MIMDIQGLCPDKTAVGVFYTFIYVVTFDDYLMLTETSSASVTEIF